MHSWLLFHVNTSKNIIHITILCMHSCMRKREKLRTEYGYYSSNGGSVSLSLSLFHIANILYDTHVTFDTHNSPSLASIIFFFSFSFFFFFVLFCFYSFVITAVAAILFACVFSRIHSHCILPNK